ncbi:MAG: hypothetical protein KFB93_01495 [Simkaniaceae bacterium]|nr:MAG: hypothetical protein KFB93_01495 [Simkaniaceae bacterium]
MKTLEKSPLLRTLPLLDFTADYFEKVDFTKTLIICVQHLYSTTYNMFDKLFRMGLKPSNLHIVGKCYSTDPQVFDQLKKDGVNVSTLSNYFDSHSPYDTNFEKKIEDFFDEIIQTTSLESYEKIIILDDGGFLCRIANRKLPKLSNIIGVEQTSAGFNRIKREGSFFPVINTARSHVKMKHESPIIINLALKKLRDKISHLDPQPKKILIMGFGTLGKVVYDNLHTSYEISAYDTDPTKNTLPTTDLHSHLKDFDLIIGATGETSLTYQDLSYLKRPVVLASISSSDREFDAVHLRMKAPQTHQCHTDLLIEGVTLLNCGFPINFDDDYQTIDTDNFQLTRSLILGAVCQAYLTDPQKPGFIELDPSFQNALEKELKS